MTFLEIVSRYIAANALLDGERLHLVALSGGADSVCLLRSLLELGYRVEAVHCNFHLRGDESNRDETFCVELCQRLQVPLHRVHFDTREYAALHGVSIEMAARDLRYKYFRQLARDIGAADICVAHHRDDNVETVLLNLCRGTGLAGLCGMQPRSRDIVRPLLCVGREEICGYLSSIGQDYVVDSTNLVADVQRNKIRLSVLPLLREINGGVDNNVVNMTMHLGEVAKIVDGAMEEGVRRVVNTSHGEMHVSVPSLLCEPSSEYLLWHILEPCGFSSKTTRQMFAHLRADSGRTWLSDTHVALLNRDELIVATRDDQWRDLKMPECGTYVSGAEKFRVESVPASQEAVSREKYVATVDADKVAFPLTVRRVQTADRFRPYGMRGTKLLSDYMTDRHFSLFRKQRQLVVAGTDGRIIWLVGERIDDRVKVTAETRQVLRITVEGSRN